MEMTRGRERAEWLRSERTSFFEVEDDILPIFLPAGNNSRGKWWESSLCYCPCDGTQFTNLPPMIIGKIR